MMELCLDFAPGKRCKRAPISNPLFYKKENIGRKENGRVTESPFTRLGGYTYCTDHACLLYCRDEDEDCEDEVPDRT